MNRYHLKISTDSIDNKNWGPLNGVNINFSNDKNCEITISASARPAFSVPRTDRFLWPIDQSAYGDVALRSASASRCQLGPSVRCGSITAWRLSPPAAILSCIFRASSASA
ncbi:N-acetylmuramic acid 6-phosphate etherase [Trichinella spiralis]|uniref:N-acetylmuramic acid 6-phosphate etherase n=1 Tax=Trichinella spiralis TaxID=6334 RepID=A0ABR3KRE6_TRISP